MVYIQTKIPIWVYFGKPRTENFCHNLWPNGISYDHLVYGMFCQEKSGSPVFEFGSKDE
jgi:hypothetical protein